MDKSNIQQQKTDLRGIYAKRRAGIDREQKAKYDKFILDAVTSCTYYRQSEVLLSYFSVNDEVATIGIIDHALCHGKTVAIPVCSGTSGKMEFCRLSSLSELEPGRYGIPVPRSRDVLGENMWSCGFCVVPALSFDKCFYRLGYGGGFYDRFLSGFTGVSCGVCYSDLLSCRLPVCEFDQRVDLIVTDGPIMENDWGKVDEQ